jgi:hypothetical protein
MVTKHDNEYIKQRASGPTAILRRKFLARSREMVQTMEAAAQKPGVAQANQKEHDKEILEIQVDLLLQDCKTHGLRIASREAYYGPLGRTRHQRALDIFHERQRRLEQTAEAKLITDNVTKAAADGRGDALRANAGEQPELKAKIDPSVTMRTPGGR